MPRKKNITENTLIANYIEFVLEKNYKPTSVFSFAKHCNFEEAQFYNYFGTFDALENAIFSHFFKHTIEILHKSEEFATFDARNKLLSFYFTFFEILTANRSYVVHALKGDLKKLKALQNLKNDFKNFTDSLAIEKIDIKNQHIEKVQEKALQESAWLQLLVTLKFWLDDSSPSFEKTDIFIEKSVNASFDLMDIKPVKSIIDFGKFVLKEKLNFHS